MNDPTYNKDEIKKNPIWELAFIISEIRNDMAPIGWNNYIYLATNLLNHYEMKRKDTKY